MTTRAHTFSTNPAPWAEVVPGMGPMRVDDLLAIQDDGYSYEVVEGILVRMAGSGEEATFIGNIINNALFNFVIPRRLGVVTPADGIYRFPGAETGLLPDVGYYARERHPDHRFSPQPIPFAPDLAVEVVSPDQTADDMATKARTYLQGGTLLVWVVWPRTQCIDVWHSENRAEPVAILQRDDTLEGEDVVPGFTCAVADLFIDPFA